MEAGKMEAEQMEAGQLEAGNPGDWDFSPNSALFPQISQAFSTVSCLKALQNQSKACLAGENLTMNELGARGGWNPGQVSFLALAGPLAVRAAPA